MASLRNPPQRLKLMALVQRSFARAGWSVEHRNDDSHDFHIKINCICLLIKCIDDSRIDYESPSAIIIKLERYAREIRSRLNRQLVVIFDRNFLGTPLEKLVDRGIFAITADEIEVVSSLAAVSDRIPGPLLPSQKYILDRANDYAIHVSQLCRKAGDNDAAVYWARKAVDHCAGYSYVHIHLFRLLKDLGDFEAAAEVGKEIGRYRPDDPQFIRGMADLAHQRGDQAEAAKWQARLVEQPTNPRTLNDILTKQWQQNGSTNTTKSEGPSLSYQSEPPRSPIVRLLSGFWRRTGH